MQLAGYGLPGIYLRPTSVNNESTSHTLRADVAGAIIVHSLTSFLEGRERRSSPQSRLLSRSLFRRSRTYTPPAPDPPSPCIFEETPAHPGSRPPQRRQDGRSPRERKACARRSPRIVPLTRECKGYGIVWAPW